MNIHQIKTAAFTLIYFSIPSFSAQVLDSKGELLIYPYKKADLTIDLTALTTSHQNTTLKEIENKLDAGKARLGQTNAEIVNYKKFISFIFGGSYNINNEFDKSQNAFYAKALSLKSGNGYYLTAKNEIGLGKHYNIALLEFYQEKYKDAPFKSDDLKLILEYKAFTNAYYNRLKAVLDSIQKLNYTSDGALLFKTLNANFNSDATLSAIKVKLNTEWVKSWLWLREGSLVINPLDFSSKEFIESRLQFDSIKAEKYNKYISAALVEMEKKPTEAERLRYKELLNELNKGKDVFALAELNRDLVKNNEKALLALVTTTAILNNLPPAVAKSKAIADTFGLNYSSGKLVAQARKSKIDLPATTSEQRNVYVYNIPPNVNVILKEENKAITDQSGFQAFLNDVGQNLGQLAVTIGSLSPFSTLFETISAPLKMALPTESSSRLRLTESLNSIAFSFDGSDRDPKSQKQIKIAELKKKHPAIAEYIKLTDENDIDVLYHLFVERSVNPVDTVRILMTRHKEKFELHVYYLRELKTIFLNATPPADPGMLKQRSVDSLALRTKLLSTNTSEDAIQKTAKIHAVKKTGTKNDTTLLKDFKYKVGKRYPFTLSAGFIFNIPRGNADTEISQTTVTNPATGQIEVKNFNQPYRFVAGFNIYPFKKGLFLQDDGFFPKRGRFWNRASIYFGCAISKKPLDNLYIGLTYDLVPGLKINFGPQLYRNDKVKVLNNEIIAQKVHYDNAWFFGVHIDPISLTGFLTNINKIKK
jgi:hypothetical protein